MRLPRARGARGRGMGGPRMPMMGPRHPRMMPELPPPPPFRIPRGPLRMRPVPSFPYDYSYDDYDSSILDLPPRPPYPSFHPGGRYPPVPRPLRMRPPRSYGLSPASSYQRDFDYNLMAASAPPGRLPFMGNGRGRGRGVGVGGRGRGAKRIAASSNGGPKKTTKRKQKKRTAEMESEKPWVNEALKAEIVKKYELYEIAKEKMTDSDWNIWKEQRLLVSQMVNAAKLEYIGLHPELDPQQIMLGHAPKTTTA